MVILLFCLYFGIRICSNIKLDLVALILASTQSISECHVSSLSGILLIVNTLVKTLPWQNNKTDPKQNNVSGVRYFAVTRPQGQGEPPLVSYR